MGGSHEAREEWDKAKEEYQRAVEVLAAAFGAAHWKTHEPEWTGRTVELLKAMNADDRRDWSEAYEKVQEVFRLEERGEYRKALSLTEEVLTVHERLLGRPSRHRDFSEQPGVSMREDGRLRAGRAALPAEPRHCGEDSWTRASRNCDSLSNLAGLCKEMGDTARAEPLYQRSAKIFEKALGPAHPSTAAVVGNLAGLYKEMGDYAQAESLYQRSLEIRERALGPDHPDTANKS